MKDIMYPEEIKMSSIEMHYRTDETRVLYQNKWKFLFELETVATVLFDIEVNIGLLWAHSQRDNFRHMWE